MTIGGRIFRPDRRPGSTRTSGPPGRRSEAVAGYLFIAVPMVLFLVLFIGSIAYAGWISLWDWNLRLGPEEFRGLDNYVRALRDPACLRRGHASDLVSRRLTNPSARPQVGVSPVEVWGAQRATRDRLVALAT